MDVHKNARLTVHCRELLVERVLLRGEPQVQAARRFAISVKTVQKWLRRYQQEGASGLQDRSCRPRRSPRATVRELSLAVLALRRQRLTLLGIARGLGLSRSTVARICATAGLQRLSSLEPPVVVQRYERAQPGELLHLDVKKLGRITRIGHRITGDRSGRYGKAGWEFVHVAIDDTSRVAYAQPLPDEQGDSVTMFLRAAVAYYAGLGIVSAKCSPTMVAATAVSSLPGRVAILPCAIASLDPTPRAPMARPSVLSRRHCASGPMHEPIPALCSASLTCLAGCTATTGIALMPR
jgi:transposase-like protein